MEHIKISLCVYVNFLSREAGEGDRSPKTAKPAVERVVEREGRHAGA
jgi:hypothetical protein